MSEWMLLLIFSSGSMLSFVVISHAVPKMISVAHELVEHTEFVLRGLFIFSHAAYWVVAYVVFVLLIQIFMFVLTRNVFITGLVLLGLVVLPRVLLKLMRRNRRQQIIDCLPDALLQLSASLRAGSSYPVAVQLLIDQQQGPFAEELSLMLREQRVGIRLEDALENLAERVQCEEIDLMVSAVTIAQDVGGNLAGVLFDLSGTIRQKLLLEGKVRSLTAQGTLQAYVISALPLCILGALVIVEPDSTLPIFHGLLGWICLAAMLLMQLTGGMMIKRIVSITL